jgi:hypothetical protein
MEENKKILLPSKRYHKSPEEELNLEMGLETSQSLLRIGDKDIVLDIAELFNKERNESTNYKVYGKLKMVFRNMYSGTSEYEYLTERLYLNGDGADNNFHGFLPYDEYAFLRRDVYRQINTATNAGATLGVFNYTPGTTGSTEHRTITPIQAPYHNWNIYLTNAYSKQSDYPMQYTLNDGIHSKVKISYTAQDGIPFRVIDEGNFYKLTSPVQHGMSEGEYIVLSGKTLTSSVALSGKTFFINSVGNEVFNSENYVINIAKSQFKQNFTLSTDVIVLGRRCLNVNDTSSISSYYVHKVKTLTSVNDYIMDQIGFETPIWEDEKKLLLENSVGQGDVLVERNRMESVLYDFKESIVLSGLTNHMGYTPTEVYLAVVNRNGDGYFNYPPKVGYSFNFHNTWIDEHFDGSDSYETGMIGHTTTFTGVGGTSFTAGDELPVGTILTGAFVEYNRKEMKERIISEPYHKMTIKPSVFNHGQTGDVTSFIGATTTNPFGMYYQSLYRIKLRELSPYTETATTNDIYNLPENVTYDSTEKVWRWRDLYDHGYVDVDGYGTNFPFINNTHYVKNDFNFYLRNERYYNNKTDGISSFKNKKIDC